MLMVMSLVVVLRTSRAHPKPPDASGGFGILCAGIRMVQSINHRTYAVPIQTGRLTRWKPDSPAAAWYFFVFLQKICTKCKFFARKDGIFRPAGGDISFRGRDRVTRVNHRTYAVPIQTGRLTRWKPDSPAAAWYFFVFTTCWRFAPTCREKDQVFSALPEARFPSGFVTA